MKKNLLLGRCPYGDGKHWKSREHSSIVFQRIEAMVFLEYNKRHHTKCGCVTCTGISQVDVILERVEIFAEEDNRSGHSHSSSDETPNAQATSARSVGRQVNASMEAPSASKTGGICSHAQTTPVVSEEVTLASPDPGVREGRRRIESIETPCSSNRRSSWPRT